MKKLILNWQRLLLITVFVAVLIFGVGAILNMEMDAPLHIGDAGSKIQSAFDAAIPLREEAIGLWAGLRWALFGQGYRGVLPGRDGWLFSTEEFEEFPAGSIAAPFEFIREVNDELLERGIALVLAPVPAKARVCADYLPGPIPWVNRYVTILEKCLELGIPAVDLNTALEKYQPQGPQGAAPDGKSELLGTAPSENAASKEQRNFLRTDTHWTPSGAARAAYAIAQAILDFFPLSERKIKVEIGEKEPYLGDLLFFLPLKAPSWQPLPPPDLLAPIYFTEMGAAPNKDFAEMGAAPDAPDAPSDLVAALFAMPDLPVALVGTSYSAARQWGFAGFLEAELGQDLLNLAVEGKGPFEPMKAALVDSLLEDNGVRLVIWEIPERYINQY